ncbi:endolytic transglycosylase MltG [candidate division WOR-3 bacterium]|uniref:Endolytic murein transglycosylase n=1 Tax=candidate division WOR-3 bacterium TaxID=2052148 RepID=A0A660SLW8_UNCW3|nr:MAG: endolytic transglycosylase MltG [candidate division WOR-3 bacterium]
MLKIGTVIILLVLSLIYNPISGPKVRIFVYPAEPLTTVVESLRTKDVLVSPFLMIALSRVLGWERRIRPGYYYIGRTETPLSILLKLRRGGIDTIRVTIPEGFSLQQITHRLARLGLIDIDTFTRLAHDPEFIGRLGFPGVTTLEGLLFPDTYIFSIFNSEEEIITRMVKRFKEIIKQLGIRDSLYPILTLASIVEKEAKIDSERPIIAAIFLKRLRNGRPLESCATVNYALGGHRRRLRLSDLRIDSPYNTYRYPGLPPTPICSPGKASLKAVMNPKETQYLYFVSNGHGGHYFSTTYWGHLLAKRRKGG